MTTYKQIRMAALALLMCAAAVACKSSTTGGGSGKSGGGTGGSSSSTGGTTGGSSGSTGGGAGGAAKMCVNTGDDNLDCPPVKPMTGDCAPKGVCCHRASNVEKEKALAPDDPIVLEYRLNNQLTINHPMTIGQALIAGQSTQLQDTEQQSLLWRFQLPRKGGMEVSGMGKTTIGIGEYNCDGTYSYYTKTAATPVANVATDPARWAADELDAVVDVTKNGADRMKVPFAMNTNRKLVYTPYLNLNTFELDWELINQGYTMTELDTSAAGRDCMGARSGNSWKAAGNAKFEVFTPLKDNNKQVIASIMQTYCQLVSFGILAANQKTLDCNKEARCMPGASNCPWKKLPDALCPEGADEMALFNCHLGALGNVNAEDGYPADPDVKCTMDKPTTPQDPDTAPGTKGQCCDPMGKSTTLPMCNAYRLIQSAVVAAATITKTRSDKLQTNCTQ